MRTSFKSVHQKTVQTLKAISQHLEVEAEDWEFKASSQNTVSLGYTKTDSKKKQRAYNKTNTEEVRKDS